MPYKIRRGHVLILSVATTLLAGCLASNPTQVASDPAEPQLGSFRYEQIVRNEGLRGDFAFEIQEKLTVAPDRQRVDSTFKFTGYILGRLVDARDTLTLTRLDKDLIWEVNPKEKRYLEIPITKVALWNGQVPQDDPKGEKVFVEDCCKVNTSVKRTGTRKLINGFDAEQVILTVSSQCNEQLGQPNTTTMRMEVWVAAAAALGPEVAAFHDAWARKSGFDADAARAMGEQMFTLFPQAKDLFALLKGLKGMPVYWVLTVEDAGWLKRKEQESKTAAREGSGGAPRSLTDLAMGLGTKLFKERQEAKEKENDLKWGNVIFRVTWETRNFERVPVGVSRYDLPPQVQKVESREQVAGGEAGKTQIENKPARYVPTACFSTLDQARLGVPLPPKAVVARSRPFDHDDHNTRYYYNNRTDFRVPYASPETAQQIAAFYEKALKVKCVVGSNDGDKEWLCRKGGQTVRITDRPVEMKAGVSVAGVQSGDVPTEKMIGVEITGGK